jgi:lysophospholipid acyltransferase (LPLAT)-like uncharacterized protein
MKKLFDKVLRSSLGQQTLAFLVACYIKFVYKTTRWKFMGLDHLKNRVETDVPIIACFWHGRLGMMTCLWQWKKPFSMLLSAHRDGRFISRVISHFGITSIYGSSQRKGTQAALSVLSTLNEGVSIGITPDGPRGPNQIARKGIATLSLISQKEVIPVSYATTKRYFFKSWDRFHFPLPFGRGVFYCGEPIDPKNFQDTESLRQAIEEGLNVATEQAEHLCQKLF